MSVDWNKVEIKVRGDFLTKLRSYAIAMVALLASVILVAVATWFKQYELLAVIGLMMTIGFWRYRKSETWGNAICFLGIFVLAYGVLALWAVWDA